MIRNQLHNRLWWRRLETHTGGHSYGRLGALVAAVLFAGALAAPESLAIEISLADGEVRGSFDTTISIGASLRVSEADQAIIGRENGGDANSVNGDNGNLNYESGDFTSVSGKITHELELGYKNFSVFSRAFYFYDTIVTDSDPARTAISDRAKDEIGRDFELLDAYGAVDFSLGDVYVTVRGGNQVLSWGESTFIQNGINTISPIDVSKLRVAGAELRDGLTAVPMGQIFLGLSDRFSAEGFYQMAWDHTEIEPEGTFFSTNDFASPGGEFVMLGFGAPGISDNPVFMDANIPVGSAVPRQRDRDAKDEGQFGAVLRWFEPKFNDTEFGFYFTRLHSRLPVISAVTGTEIGLADGNYAATARYFREFPEDVDTYGFSFNTEIPAVNTALQGEFAYHVDQPLQVDDVELLFAALTPVSAPLFGQNQLGVYGFDEEITGWRPKDVWQTQFTLTKLFGPNLGSDQIAVLGEYGVTVIPDLEDQDVLRYEAAGTYTSGNPFFTEQGGATGDPGRRVRGRHLDGVPARCAGRIHQCHRCLQPDPTDRVVARREWDFAVPVGQFHRGPQDRDGIDGCRLSLRLGRQGFVHELIRRRRIQSSERPRLRIADRELLVLRERQRRPEPQPNRTEEAARPASRRGESRMTHRFLHSLTWTAAAALCAALVFQVTSASAKVSSAEAGKLTGELTPLGAIRAANSDGTIPAWEGGITSPPAGYDPSRQHIDPYAGEQPLFRITAQNADQYREQLSPGQIAMLERYPDTWYLEVYPTHRSASYPQEVYDAAVENATSAELTPDGNGLTGARLTSAFPIPQNGLEAIWNHLLRYRGRQLHRNVGQVAPTPGGSYTMVTIDERILWLYTAEGATSDNTDNLLAYFLQTVEAPARLAGRILLVHETLNQAAEPRAAWTYNTGQRRVRRAPNVAYDNPGTASDAQRTSDQLDLFNGAPDRYEWTLVGRQEMYVPYNTYRLHSDEVKYDQIIQAGHINPELARYEKHRVWVVDAKVKKGTSHIYARRTFYLDEDSWQALVVDQYDSRGEIWRVSEAYCINYYEQPLFWDTLQCHYDLQNGRYLAFGLNNEGMVDDFEIKLSGGEFTPDALRREGRR